MKLQRWLSRSLVAAAMVFGIGGCGDPPTDDEAVLQAVEEQARADVEPEPGVCNLADPAGDGSAPFCLSTSWGSGSVVPDGHWSYTIRIGPGPTGRIDVSAGYGSQTYTREFEVSGDDLAELRHYMESVDLMGAEEVDDIPIGGSPIGLAIVRDGVATTYGDWLADPWESRKYDLASRAAALVPDALWAELSATSGRRLRSLAPG